mmetsp:Transcript_107684/g.300037  ORF Transcript_107684/g.300037 Transcript_107684/m.300037 type:complete len:301 (+) Transcript_107684:105-1007(+)
MAVAEECNVEGALEEISALQRSGDRQGQAAALCRLVGQYVSQRQLPEAMASAEEALAVLRDLKDAKGQVAVFRSVTGLDLARERPEDALQAAKRAAMHFRSRGDKEGEAFGQLACAAACAASHEAAKSVAAVTLALGLFQKVSSKEGECIAFQVASRAQLLSGDAKEALRMAEKARALAQSLLGDRPELEAASLLAVAEAQLAKASDFKSEENYRKAGLAARLAMEKYGELGDSQGQQLALYVNTRAARGERELGGTAAGELPGEAVAPALQYSTLKKIGANALEGPRSMMYQVNGGRLI